jgi:UDP-N-acetylmuramoylalanine--D-glutamate ligase
MDLKNKKVTIYGAGKSGVSALRLLTEQGAICSIVSRDWSNLSEIQTMISQDSCFDDQDDEIFSNSDLIILSPGISLENPNLQKAISKKVPIISEIELAFQFVNCPVIGITGTNGKTTTVSFIREILDKTELKVFTGGNIGIPFCDAITSNIEWDLVLLELSSFQLETIVNFRPHIAMILNISHNHGERYNSLLDYTKAKFNIIKNMKDNDYFFYPRSDSSFESLVKESKGTPQLTAVDYSNLEEIKTTLSKTYNLDQFKLIGDHNLLNLYSVHLILEKLEIRKEFIQKGIDNFAGVSHRLEYVGSNLSFKVYNDAKSTNLMATISALKSFSPQKKNILILGGQKRGREDSVLPQIEFLKKYCSEVILIGETTDCLAEELSNKINLYKAYTLENAIDCLRNGIADKKIDSLIFSPGFPSFDQFNNYEERGNRFKSIITSL